MKNNLYIALLALLFTGCDNFVDILPKGKNIPTTVDDLAKILNTDNNIGGGGQNWFYMSDDPFIPEDQIKSGSTTELNAYTWASYQYSSTEKDSDWAIHYMIIYFANYVIEHVASASEGMDYNREETLGRALLHRAYSYWYLISAYAPWYDKATAATEAGVPMPLVSDINKQYPRSTVEQVYGQILADVEKAIALEGMPDWRQYNSWPCRAAAYALLSRIYLFQKDYEKAASYAKMVMDIRDVLTDYNEISMTDPNNAAKGLKGYEQYAILDPEVILSKTAGNNYTDVMVSDELVRCYDKSRDLRFRYCFSTKTRYDKVLNGYMRVNDNQTFDGIRMSEVYLNRIEALVRMGGQDHTQEALRLLDVLRRHRYDRTDYQAITTIDQQILLEEVLLERRRELRFTCFRWFDLKRLNTEAATGVTLSRRDADGNLVTLEPGSPRYTWAIPLDVMEQNPQLIQNKR